MTDYTQMIIDAATKYGVDPRTALRVAKAEGGTSGWVPSRVPGRGGGTEPSYGPFQMLIGGEGTGYGKGMGNAFMAATGKDPRQPSSEYFDYAMKHAAQNGWGQWYGARDTGISNWEGIRSKGLTLTSSPQQAPVTVAAGEQAPPLPDPRTITDRPVVAAQEDAAPTPSIWSQIGDGDWKGAGETIKNAMANADDDKLAGFGDLLSGQGSAQQEQNREAANIQPSGIGQSFGAEQAARVQAAQQMMAQLMMNKKKGKVPGLSLMG